VLAQEDNSLTRSNAYLLQLFQKSNMEVLYNVKQGNFPKHLFEVQELPIAFFVSVVLQMDTPKPCSCVGDVASASFN
jgi:hypothetical protein